MFQTVAAQAISHLIVVLEEDHESMRRERPG
jgi:hypothetical protein